MFPGTRVAAIEHRGPPALEHDTAHKLIAWKIEQRLLDPEKHRHYGLHYTDPRSTPPPEHRVDFCPSIDADVAPNPYGIIASVMPAVRCARARDIGSRWNNQAAVYLLETWLPGSGETSGDYPLIFHYVNVGTNVPESEMITDVYLSLK